MKQTNDSLITREEAAKRLNCHWQTLLYRANKYKLKTFTIKKRKYYVASEIDEMKQSKPVKNRPHCSKRNGFKVERLTLWQRIKAKIKSIL